jgi:hypothetical protein
VNAIDVVSPDDKNGECGWWVNWIKMSELADFVAPWEKILH